MGTEADRQEAQALLTLFGNNEQGRQNLYKTLTRGEQRFVAKRLGGFYRGALVMRRFDQAKYAWLEAMTEVAMVRRICDGSS